MSESDIVERLKRRTSQSVRSNYSPLDKELDEDAAAEIKRLRAALASIRDADPVDMALDPQWPSRIARAALQSTD